MRQRPDDQGDLAEEQAERQTHFYDANGKRVTLTVGQTFIQVLDTGSKVTIRRAKRRRAVTPAAPATSPTPGPG